jgi:hypothetical protein
MFLKRGMLACVCLLAATPLQAQKAKLLVPLDSLIARVQRDSNDAPAHYEVALGYWLAKKYDLAEAHLREAIAIEPKTATAYLALSYLPFARNSGLWGDVEKGKVSAEWLPTVEEAYHLAQSSLPAGPAGGSQATRADDSANRHLRPVAPRCRDLHLHHERAGKLLDRRL